jgi:DNA-binding NtrC family response regulator
VRRVGGTRDRRIDVRILAATNRDLERAAQQGTFRSDLYFRLAVIILHLPPLRERGEDVLVLAEEFLGRFNAKYGKQVRRLDQQARDLLLAYPWPGNVRELSHVIERAVLWSRGETLDPRHLALTRTANGEEPPTTAERSVPAGVSAPASAPASGSGVPPSGTDLEQWERTLIEQAMRESDGNQTRAAARLGITRDTLRYRLKKHGLV